MLMADNPRNNAPAWQPGSGAASSGAPKPKPRRRHLLLKIAAIVVGSILGIVFLILCGISLFLTPERLTRLVNREASQYLNADITAHNVSYTLWSTFPRFRLTTDSIVVRSRTLDSIPAAIRSQLPEDADFLGSLSRFQGSINFVDLFLNRYVIHDVRVDGLRINLVAYNDSINNYSIIPSSGEKMKRVPYFSAKLVALRNPGVISYFSKASDTKASLQLSQLTLTRLSRHEADNTYKLTLGGNATANSSGIHVLSHFPFSLDGEVKLKFNPFAVALTDYAINLGDIHSRLSMNLGIGENPRIESFDYKIRPVNLMSLLGYIPHEYLPSLEGLSADMPVSASARLLSSWNLSSEIFPSVEINFDLPEGDIAYTVSIPAAKGAPMLRTYQLEHSPISARFIFDGEAPDSSYIEVPDFKVFTSGIMAEIGGKVTRLTSHPLIQSNLSVEADIARAMGIFPSNPQMQASGQLESRTSLSFTLDDFSRQALAKGLEEIFVSGDVRLSRLAIDYPARQISFKAHRLTASVGDRASALTLSGISNPLAEAFMRIDSASVTTTAGTFRIADLDVKASSRVPGVLSASKLHSGLPLRLNLSSSCLSYADSAGSMQAVASGVRLKDVMTRTSTSSLTHLLADGLHLEANSLSVAKGADTCVVSSPALSFAISRRPDSDAQSAASADSATSASQSPASPPLARSDSRLNPADDPGQIPPHSPEYLNFTLPEGLKEFLDDWSFSSDLQFKRLTLQSPRFSSSDYLANADMSVSDTAMTIRHLDLSLSGTPAHIMAHAGNLRGFLTLPPSEQNALDLTLGADISHIDINALSRAYVESKGGEQNIPHHPAPTASDSVAMLVPRNIRADIRAGVGEIDYTNLDLTDVLARIKIENGVADIDTLAITSSFGSALASICYDSSDIEHMNISADVAMNNLDIVKFFAKFHSLLEMMPQMKNLSGDISLQAKADCDIYPYMYLNIPSAQADVTVEGRNLKVHQNKFIRRITRMMLIRTSDDIHIRNMDVHASIRNNLLQLYPFDFEFDRYKLHMLGVNNFDGKLYYQIAVEKSPVPFPFAINVEGMFSNPELRFGAARFDLRRGAEVTSQIQESHKVNMMDMLNKFLRVFITTGARYHAEE